MKIMTIAEASDMRAALHSIMGYGLSEEAALHDWTYDAIRPMPVPTPTRKFLHVAKRGDCSKGVQYNCWWVPGCPDPMGRGFDPYGNSQTIWLHLHHVAHPSELEVGDPVTFGVAGEEHAAVVLERGADPLMWSFGHQGAPNTYRLSYDKRPQQWLKLPLAAEVITPEDKLRALTGFFSWVAWKQGEGPWKHYGPAKAAVRPNVPKIISQVWWARYAKFLANRKKGNTTGTKHLKEALQS